MGGSFFGTLFKKNGTFLNCDEVDDRWLLKKGCLKLYK